MKDIGGVGMISFIICLALLIGGYFVYGKVVENTFAPDDRETPAVRINDGVDYVIMPQWKLFLVQLLNIAGLGPIFGAMQGALWGPVVFLWITFGTIFAGGVHDYFSGMLSERNDGASISEVCGIYLGNVMKNVMRVFSVVLLVMQVAGSGGTFPIEVAPAFFKAVYPLLPFVHSMAALRETIGGMYGMTYWTELGKLGIFLILSLILGLLLRKPVIRMNEAFAEKLEETKIM